MWRSTWILKDLQFVPTYNETLHNERNIFMELSTKYASSSINYAVVNILQCYITETLTWIRRMFILKKHQHFLA